MFHLNTRYDGSIVYADLRVVRIVKIVLNITDYNSEIEELEVSKLLDLSATLSSHDTEMLVEEDSV